MLIHLQTKISDLVQIAPEDFSKSSISAIEDNINAKYSNKVIQEVGLCICLYDVLSASEGLIGHGTGIVNVNGRQPLTSLRRDFLLILVTVEFRLIVFRPFKHEVMFGKISSSSVHGIRLRLDFFDEITVTPDMLPENTYFDHNEQVWIWRNEGADDLYFDNHESVRFRVEAEEWVDQSPLGPSDKEEGIERESPYRIIASMAESGLGPCLWWDGDDDDDDDEEAAT
ncbi:MAG: DNA-directed RNA polymerase III subunit rpc25 [Claussenomyces sp. TS43310]|nr:MAG: DNA-directed RNA polymerase III subunit rpc25 [Claussenomyces sp. TS43310]